MITSQQNPLIKRIRRLRQKKYRQREKAFFVEGLRPVLSAIEASAQLERLIYCKELLTSEVGWTSIDQMQRLGVPVNSVSIEVFQSISFRENPVGLGAVVKAQWNNYRELPITNQSIFIGLVEISEPGNLGAVIRTADAVYTSGIVLVGEAVDPFHPTAVKASMGTLFSSPICWESSVHSLISWAVDAGLQIVSTSSKGEFSFWEVEYKLPALLLMGPERTGLPKELLTRADTSVRIPMSGGASSLNLSVAAGLLLYEMRRSTRTMV